MVIGFCPSLPATDLENTEEHSGNCACGWVRCASVSSRRTVNRLLGFAVKDRKALIDEDTGCC